MSKLVKNRGIVLLQRKYSESSIIASIYTLQFGIQSFFVPGARKHRAKTKSSLFSPLSILDIEQYRNEKGGLQKLKDVSLSVPLGMLRSDIIKGSIALFLAEFLSQVLKEEENNASLFGFLEHSVTLLDQVDKSAANFHLIFLTQLAQFLGFHPQSNYSSSNQYFDIKEGVFVAGQTAFTLPLHTSNLLGQVMRTDFRSMDDLHLNHNQRTASLQAILKYYNWHIPSMKEIQSLDVLTTIFS